MNSLKPLRHSTKLMDDFYVFDLETGFKKDGVIKWAFGGEIIFGIVYGKNFVKILYTKKDFEKEFLNDRYKNKKVFAHNAEFDLTKIFGNIYKKFPDAIFNGKFISCTNKNCSFADSLNIYRTSAKTIGEMLGILKGGMSGDGGYKETNWNDHTEKLRAINGCIRDCEIIWEALFRIFEKVGSIKITQASLSLDYFKRYFLDHVLEHNENTKFFFDSYCGGRTEAFKIGKVNGAVIDVNSMYPFCMRNLKFPNPKFLRVEENVSVKKLNYYLKNFEGCIYCDVEHPDIWLGLLPIKHGGKLLFPVGKFNGCWNFNEIRFALLHGVKIKKIERIVYAPAMDSIFRRFVDTLYAERFASENEFHIYVIKVFLNSLYGKFSQRIDEEWIYIADMEKSIDQIRAAQLKNSLIRIVPFNSERKDCFLVSSSDNEWCKDFSIPSFASYITSAARVYLAEKMLYLGENKVLYCDTDGIFFSGKNNFKKTRELGGWKPENKIITYIGGLKNYKYKILKTVKWLTKEGETKIWIIKRKIKGVPDRALEYENHKYRYTNLLKTKESLRRNLNSGDEIERTKIIKNTYTKRIVLKNGKTKPVKL